MNINTRLTQVVSVGIDIGRSHQLRDGTPYLIKTGLDLPDLFQQTTALNSALWPEFIQENPTTENFYELYARFPEYQFALVTEQGTLIAVGNSVPLAWDGKPHDLPAGGWDWAYKQAFADDDAGKTPTIQSALAITVAPEFLGQGVSREAILAMKGLGKEARLTALIAPVRPNQKHAYPLIDMYDYLKWLRDDGQPFDAWVRTHTKLGGKIIKPALRSMHITGSVADWEKWAGLKMPKSGQYIVPKALIPVNIDVENDLGIYLEPNVWIWHPMDAPAPEQKKVASAALHRQQTFPLTAEQRQIWFAEQLHPDTSMYNNGFLFSLEGDIDYPKFNQAFQTLVNHTDILRTIINEENGEPAQSLTQIDASLPLIEAIADVQTWAAARTSHHRFDMSQPMFDSALLQSSDGQWHWYISLHHIIGDGWTLQLLLERMSALYAQGKSAVNNWPQFLPVADPITQTNNPEADAYWRKKVSQELDEPTFYGAKSKSTSTQFERVWVDLGAERTAKLHETLQHEQIFVKNKHITLYNSMMAVTATWLSRIGNLTDFAIGSPLLTRPTADLRQTAGMISRYVPLHFHIDEQASFVSLVQQSATEAQVCNKHNVVSVPS